MLKIIIYLFLFGFSFGFGPCLASCGPMLIAYLAGTKKNTFKSVIYYLIFSSARIIVYLFLGLLLFFLGRYLTESFLGGFSKYVFILGGIFVIITGLLMCHSDPEAKPKGKNPFLDSSSPEPTIKRNEWLFRMTKHSFGICRFLQKNIIEKDVKSIFIFGLIIGLLPCAPLLVIFSYVALVAKTWVMAFVYILFFGIGTLISPLLILAAVSGLLPKLLDKKAVYERILRVACGLIIIYLGIELIRRGV